MSARGRARSPGRQPGQTSPAIRRASRKNGKLGGELGGRPRDRLPAAVIKALGSPPKGDPTKLRAWCIDVLAEVTWLSAQGKIGSELAASMRANLGAVEKALPPPMRRDDEDDEPSDAEDRGPELAEVDVDEPLHGE